MFQAWFYKWRRGPAEPTKREVRRAAWEERITYFFREWGDTYGSPRITLDLWADGWKVSVNTVAEVMADLGLQGRKPPRRRHSLTRQGRRRAAPGLVHRMFNAIAPDVLWVGDMTEIDTDEGRLCLATVLDLFSRRVLGYAMGPHHDAVLVGASLKMAAATRGDAVSGVIFHSDRGSEHTSAAYNGLCDRLGVVQSTACVGSALDNAAAESFNSLIKVEYIHRQHFTTRDQARIKIATWIADFYSTAADTPRRSAIHPPSSNGSSAKLAPTAFWYRPRTGGRRFTPASDGLFSLAAPVHQRITGLAAERLPEPNEPGTAEPEHVLTNKGPVVRLWCQMPALNCGFVASS